VRTLTVAARRPSESTRGRRSVLQEWKWETEHRGTSSEMKHGNLALRSQEAGALLSSLPRLCKHM